MPLVLIAKADLGTIAVKWGFVRLGDLGSRDYAALCQERPVWIAAAKQDIFEADLHWPAAACVRPVCTAHAAAGPDGFRKPSPKPLLGQ